MTAGVLQYQTQGDGNYWLVRAHAKSLQSYLILRSGIWNRFSPFMSLNNTGDFRLGFLPCDITWAGTVLVTFVAGIRMSVKPGDHFLILIVLGACADYCAESTSITPRDALYF